MRITVLDRQSVFDIAVQSAGGVEAAFEMAMLNNVSITDDLESGQDLLLPLVENREIVNYYTNRQLKPATSITDEGLMEDARIFDDTFDLTFE